MKPMSPRVPRVLPIEPASIGSTSLLDLLAVAVGNVDLLAEPDALREAADDVARIAHQLGAKRLVAATSAAERIVGAALVMHSSWLRLYSPRSDGLVDDGSVLVVDVNVASGTAMARAADGARRSGASTVYGVAVFALDSTVGAAECGVEDLAVLTRVAARPVTPSR